MHTWVLHTLLHTYYYSHTCTFFTLHTLPAYLDMPVYHHFILFSHLLGFCYTYHCSLPPHWLPVFLTHSTTMPVFVLLFSVSVPATTTHTILTAHSFTTAVDFGSFVFTTHYTPPPPLGTWFLPRFVSALHLRSVLDPTLLSTFLPLPVFPTPIWFPGTGYLPFPTPTSFFCTHILPLHRSRSTSRSWFLPACCHAASAALPFYCALTCCLLLRGCRIPPLNSACYYDGCIPCIFTVITCTAGSHHNAPAPS